MKKILLTLLFLFVASRCLSAPTNTMSITVPVDATVVSAADETARYNEVTTKFNAHSHEDLTKSTSNTFTIGNNAVGDKTFAVSTDDANDPAVRFNTTTNLWTISNDGVTYSTHDLVTGTVNLQGTQTISGAKTFSGGVNMNNNQVIGMLIENRTDDTGCTQTGRIWFRTDL